MIDMALSNVLYELIDKSIPAKALGRWEGKKEVRERSGLPDAASQTCACTHRDTEGLGEASNCCPCASTHVCEGNGTSAHLLSILFSP